MIIPLALVLASILQTGSQTGNPIIEIQSDLSVLDHPQSIRAYQAAGTLLDAFGPPVSSDLSFGKASGKKPVLWVFPADFNGDGADEIAQVFLKSLKKGTLQDLQLNLYLPPPVWDSNTQKVASTKKLSLGSPLGEGRVILVGAINPDGEGRDDAFVIREWADGTQSIELRKLPKKKKKKMKAPYASDATFGLVVGANNIAACGADVDGDGDQEIVCLRRASGQPDQLLVFEPPTELDGETGPAVRSDLDVDPLDGGANLTMQRIDRTGDGFDELIFIRSWGAQTGLRAQIVAAPLTVGGELGAVEFTEPNLIVPADGHDVAAVFGLAGYSAVPPRPPADLSGTWEADFSHLANGSPESLPTMTGLNALMAGADTFSILFPAFNPTNGTYSMESASIDFGATFHKIDSIATGATYLLQLGVATVSFVENELIVTGTYAGNKDPNFGPDQTITGGSFVWRRTSS